MSTPDADAWWTYFDHHFPAAECDNCSSRRTGGSYSPLSDEPPWTDCKLADEPHYDTRVQFLCNLYATFRENQREQTEQDSTEE